MIQFDKRDAINFKCYSIGTPEFIKHIHFHTGYTHVEGTQKTDIVELCKNICGVNFNIGYYDEHYPEERINIDEWLNSLKVVQELIEIQNLPKFLLY